MFSDYEYLMGSGHIVMFFTIFFHANEISPENVSFTSSCPVRNLWFCSGPFPFSRIITVANFRQNQTPVNPPKGGFSGNAGESILLKVSLLECQFDQMR